jgi:hypothetical protein
MKPVKNSESRPHNFKKLNTHFNIKLPYEEVFMLFIDPDNVIVYNLM